MSYLRNKKAIFFTLDILVAIVLVFLFSIFVISNLSYTFTDSQVTDLQLSSISSDTYLSLYAKGYLQQAISGSNTDVLHVLDTGLPEQICMTIDIISGGTIQESLTKNGCVQQDHIVILKSPLQTENVNYIVEVKTWVQ